VIEHAVPTGGEWKLIDTQKPFETTRALERFKGSAPANKVTTLVVKEELVLDETMSLTTMDLDYLRAHTRMGEIPPRVRDALAKAVQLRQTVLDIEQQMAARTQQIAEITAEQGRIRENMKTVAPQGAYYDRLLTKLNEQESTIERLQSERASLSAKHDAARRDLDDYVNGLSLEP
jgi:chromosome segregation ATPase